MNGKLWTFTMDAELYLTIFCDRREVWSGSYEAFVADGDVIPPDAVADEIHERYEMLTTDDDSRSFGPNHKRIADRIDGYDRDDLGESPDY